MKKIIGDTPLIKINYQLMNEQKSIYVKLESYNLTGSIKDRVVDYILKKAKEKNILKESMPIFEATSGNTGISLAALGAYYNHPVIIFMPDWVSQERIKLLELYGATVILVSKEEGGFEECIRRANNLAQELHGFLPKQFENNDNIEAHYHGTAQEIIKEMPSIVDAFITGIGTGGTLMGIGKRLKDQNKNTKIIAIEPMNASILKTGKVEKQDHAIEGIGDGLIPKILDQTLIDDIYLIHDQDAMNMSRLLAKKLGLSVGISSGANLLGAIKYQQEHDGNVVTIFPDDNKKYLSTELINPIDLNQEFLSNQIELLGYEIIGLEEENML